MKDLNPRRRLRAAGIHFGLSTAVTGLASVVMFLVWYPAPYASISGRMALLALLVSVDVALGPLLTAVATSPGKPRPELLRDLSFIALVQRYPQAAEPLAGIAASAGQPVAALRFLPLVSRQFSGVAVMAMPGTRRVGSLPLDGFF